MVQPITLAEVEASVETVPDEVVEFINETLIRERANLNGPGPLLVMWDRVRSKIRAGVPFGIDWTEPNVDDRWLTRLQKMYPDWTLEIRWRNAADRRYNNILVFHAAPAKPARDG